MVYFVSFPIFTVPVNKELHALMRDNIRHQGIFRYLTKLVNAIDSRFVGLLHWGVEKIFQIFTVMLYQAGGFYLVLGKDTTCCQFSLLLCALPL